MTKKRKGKNPNSEKGKIVLNRMEINFEARHEEQTKTWLNKS